MNKLWQRLLLVAIILSCGIIISLGSPPPDAASTPGHRAMGGSDKARAQTEPTKAVVYYAQDRHGPW